MLAYQAICVIAHRVFLRHREFETATTTIQHSKGFTHGGVLVPKALCRLFSGSGQGKKVEGMTRKIVCRVVVGSR
jgi:hypothetical protein